MLIGIYSILSKFWKKFLEIGPSGFDIEHYSASYSSATQITLTVDPGVTLTANRILQIKQRNSSGIYIVNDPSAITVSGTAPNYTLTLPAAVFSAGDLITVSCRVPFRAYTKLTDNLRTAVIDQPDQHFEELLLVNTTNQATQYFPSASGILLNNHQKVSVGGYLIDADATSSFQIELTDSPAPAADDWAPVYFFDAVTNTWVNIISVASSAVAKKFFCYLDTITARAMRLSFVCSSGNTNTVSISIKKAAM